MAKKRINDLSKVLIENFWAVWFLVVMSLVLIFISNQDVLARLVWQKHGNASLAYFLNRSDADLAMQIGNYYFNGGAYKLDKAKKSYETALSINSKIPLAHYQIARIYFIEGNFFEALREINKEIEINPALPNAFYVRGLIYGYSYRYIEAEKDFEEFIKRTPNNWAGYNDLAWIQAKQKKFKDAEQTILQAFKFLPEEKIRNPWLWTSLGIAYLNLKKYNKAEDACLKGLEIAQKMTPQYFWSAYPGNHPDGAEKAFKQFLATLYFNLGVIYEKSGELSKAEAEYQTYLMIASEDFYPRKEEIERKIAELNALKIND